MRQARSASARRAFSPPDIGPTGGRRKVAREAVDAEVVAKVLLAHVGRHAAHVLERTFVGTQLIELMLSEIADLETLAATKFARHRSKVSDDALDERGLACAVDTEDADALARRIEA